MLGPAGQVGPIGSTRILVDRCESVTERERGEPRESTGHIAERLGGLLANSPTGFAVIVPDRWRVA